MSSEMLESLRKVLEYPFVKKYLEGSLESSVFESDFKEFFGKDNVLLKFITYLVYLRKHAGFVVSYPNFNGENSDLVEFRRIHKKMHNIEELFYKPSLQHILQHGPEYGLGCEILSYGDLVSKDSGNVKVGSKKVWKWHGRVEEPIYEWKTAEKPVSMREIVESSSEEPAGYLCYSVCRKEGYGNRTSYGWSCYFAVCEKRVMEEILESLIRKLIKHPETMIEFLLMLFHGVFKDYDKMATPVKDGKFLLGPWQNFDSTWDFVQFKLGQSHQYGQFLMQAIEKKQIFQLHYS